MIIVIINHADYVGRRGYRILGFSSPSVCLFVCLFVCLSVRPQHNLKVFKLVIWNDLGIP